MCTFSHVVCFLAFNVIVTFTYVLSVCLLILVYCIYVEVFRNIIAASFYFKMVLVSLLQGS